MGTIRDTISCCEAPTSTNVKKRVMSSNVLEELEWRSMDVAATHAAAI